MCDSISELKSAGSRLSDITTSRFFRTEMPRWPKPIAASAKSQPPGVDALCLGQLVKAGATVVIRHAPFCCNPLLCLKPLESGIQSAMLHEQFVTGVLLNCARNGLAAGPV